MLTEKTFGLGDTSRYWRSYRLHRIALVVLFLGWIPAASLVDFLQRRLRLPVAIEYVMIILWLGAMTILGFRMALWACPNCGRTFRGLLPFLPRRCRHCGNLRQ